MFRRSDLLDRRGEGKEREKTDHHRLSFHKRKGLPCTILYTSSGRLELCEGSQTFFRIEILPGMVEKKLLTTLF